MEQQAAHPDQSRRYFSVGFRDSKVRIVFPEVDDPLRYQQQIVAKGKMIGRGEPGRKGIRPLWSGHDHDERGRRLLFDLQVRQPFGTVTANDEYADVCGPMMPNGRKRMVPFKLIVQHRRI
jgi:hypothetical protein